MITSRRRLRSTLHPQKAPTPPPEFRHPRVDHREPSPVFDFSIHRYRSTLCDVGAAAGCARRAWWSRSVRRSLAGESKWGVLTALFQQFLCLAYRLRKVTWSDPIAKKLRPEGCLSFSLTVSADRADDLWATPLGSCRRPRQEHADRNQQSSRPRNQDQRDWAEQPHVDRRRSVFAFTCSSR